MPDDPRLKTSLYIDALRRRYAGQVLTAIVAVKGDSERGGVLLRRFTRTGDAWHFERSRDMAGKPVWRQLNITALSPADSDATIARRRTIDPDIWVLDVEDPWNAFTLDAPLLDD